MNPYIVASAFVFGLASGWFVNGWKTDSETLLIQNTAAKIESGISKTLESKLADLRSNERTIIREIPKVITRTVYLNSCLDVDGLRMVNASKADTAKPANQVH